MGITKTIIITELKFHCMFLVEKFAKKEFILLLRTDKSNTKEIIDFHSCPQIMPLNDAIEILNNLYDDISETELILLKKHGIPQINFKGFSEIFFINDLNSDNLEFLCATNTNYRAGVFLDCLLSNWWIDICNGNIINAHSAVLPHARGMYAIEQIVAEDDYDKFVISVGATIHFIDSGIDTGQIIKFQQLANPLSYESIWEVKAECFLLAYNLLSQHLENNVITTVNNDSISPYNKVYLAKNFTEHVKCKAQYNYNQFKQSQLS